jgi:uncharacterized membrane protein YagU involved in acid resistance
MHLDTRTLLSPVDRLRSALAGFLAVAPMTAFMLLTQRLLPKGQQYALPPEIITKELAQKAHIRHKMGRAQVLAATTASHFGYGAAMALFYVPVAQQKKEVSLALGSGILFGLLVWVANYVALLPAVGMRESGHREPGQRNWLMIVAHIIWGATLGWLFNAFS